MGGGGGGSSGAKGDGELRKGKTIIKESYWICPQIFYL